MVVRSNKKMHFKVQSSTKTRDIIDTLVKRLEEGLGHQLYSKQQAIVIMMGT